jgi:type II secretory pathway component PulM
MTAWFDRMNLQPQERRMVLGAMVVMALLVNYWFVWPYFQEYSEVSKGLDEARRVQGRYLSETTKTNAYLVKLRDLQSRGGQVASDDAANQLQQTINKAAASAGVQINSMIPSTVSARGANGQTNQFFDDIQVTVSLVSGEPELVDFLYELGAGDSMVRVRDVSNLRLDPSQTRLQATLTLVASVQKKAPAPVARPATTPKPAVPGARPATTNRPPK